MQKKRVFSGIQPTGNIHLGNYLGAIKQWVDNQDEHENIFCVVSSHAITMPIDPKELLDKTYELCAILIACGINLQKSKLFIQSKVDYHQALAWILNCSTYMGELSRMTQYKDKSKKLKNISVGLFDYPVLMAADILLYQADLVPVGIDQKQHLELTRDIALRFNQNFGEAFKVPTPMIPKIGAKIMGLDDPTTKMSKSSSSKYNAISLLDSKDEIAKKIKKATTDSLGIVAFDENRAGIFNLLSIYECISCEPRDLIVSKFKNYGQLKEGLIELIYAELSPIQENLKQTLKDKSYIDTILLESLEYVSEIAKNTYENAKNLVGLA